MSVLAKSWSASSEPQRLLVGAVGLFLASLTLLHWGWYQHALILDTVEYHRFGAAIMDGHVPYRDFGVEYPPGALPVFALPALGKPSFSLYNREFQLLMALCGVGALAAMASVLRSLRASAERQAAALGFFALAPLVLGSVILYRYDLWPAALTVAGLAAVLARRERLGLAAIGLGIAAKAFPAVVLPPVLAYVWRTRGRGEALRCLGVAAATTAVVVLPFLAIAPHGVWESIVRQTTRPLQIESLGSALLLAAHHVGGLALTLDSSRGSQNLAGSLPDAIGAASSALLVAALVAIPLVTGVLSVAQTYLTNVVGNKVMQDLRDRLFAHLEDLSLAFYTATRSGEVQSRLANDVGGVQTTITSTASSVVSNVVVVASTLVAMLILSVPLTVLSLVLVPVFVVLSTRVGRRRRAARGRTQASLADMTSITQEALSVSGILLAKVFGRQEREVARYRAANAQQAELQVRQAMVGRSFFALTQAFFGISPALVYLVAGLQLDQGSAAISAGTLVAFTTLQTRLLMPINQLLQVSVDVQSS
ncbi:MAG TPA: ABC transporter transmembrane domain-containing protein, partial [Gaiellaceae bacterium]|nr:ABC transporter transmembrane domain-containing protein [Gaiellaceae bacterium]